MCEKVVTSVLVNPEIDSKLNPGVANEESIIYPLKDSGNDIQHF